MPAHPQTVRWQELERLAADRGQAMRQLIPRMYRELMTPQASMIWIASLQALEERGRLNASERRDLGVLLKMAQTAYSEGHCPAQQHLQYHAELVRSFAEKYKLNTATIPAPARPRHPPSAAARSLPKNATTVPPTSLVVHGRSPLQNLPDPLRRGTSPKPPVSPSGYPTGSTSHTPGRKPVPANNHGLVNASSSIPREPVAISGLGASAAKAGIHFGKPSLRPTMPPHKQAPWAPKGQPPEWMTASNANPTHKQTPWAPRGQPPAWMSSITTEQTHRAAQPKPHLQNNGPALHNGLNSRRPRPANGSLTGQAQLRFPPPPPNRPRPPVSVADRVVRGLKGFKPWKR